MLWIHVYSVEVDSMKGKHNFVLTILLLIYCSAVTIVSRQQQLLFVFMRECVLFEHCIIIELFGLMAASLK